MESLIDLESGLEKYVLDDPIMPAQEHLQNTLYDMYPNMHGRPVETSLVFAINARRIQRNDVIAFVQAGDVFIGKLLSHAKCDDCWIAVVEQWEIKDRRPSGSCRCVVRSGTGGIVIEISAIIEPLAYKAPANHNDICDVIVPKALFEFYVA